MFYTVLQEIPDWTHETVILDFVAATILTLKAVYDCIQSKKEIK